MESQLINQKLKCSVCRSENIKVEVVQVSGKTRNKGNGCLWSIGRGMLIMCTFGLWLLVGKRKGIGKTTFVNEKHAVCQSCGNSWVL